VLLFVITVTYFLCGIGEPPVVESGHQGRQIATRESPLEGCCQLLVVLLEPQQTVLKFCERGKAVRGEQLPLDDGEVNFDLIQPAGMNRSVDGDDGWPLGLQTMNRFRTAMARAVVDDPEDAGGGTIRLLAHDLGDEAIERRNARLAFAATQHAGLSHVPSRQIGPSPSPPVLVFDVLGTV